MMNQETELRSALRPWTDRAAAMVRRRIEDARLHAAAGNLPTVTARLTELAWSLKRHVGDARSQFYHAAFGQHDRQNPELHQVGLGPDAGGERAAREARILGRDYGADITDLVEDANTALQSAALAGGGDFLASWATEHVQRISSRVHGELSNSQIALFEAVGQILITPEFR
jgi:hypothetical protein